MAEIRKLAPSEKMSMEEAFPEVDPHMRPLGNQVIVQIVCMRRKSAGGIHIIESDRQFGSEQSRVARVVKIGPLAYKDRESREDWPEGAWVKVGDFVRIPAFSGADRWRIVITDESETADERRRYDEELATLNTELSDWQARVFSDKDSQRRAESRIAELEMSIKNVRTPEVITKDVHFCGFNDYDMKMQIEGDPLEVVDYI